MHQCIRTVMQPTSSLDRHFAAPKKNSIYFDFSLTNVYKCLYLHAIKCFFKKNEMHADRFNI